MGCRNIMGEYDVNKKTEFRVARYPVRRKIPVRAGLQALALTAMTPLLFCAAIGPFIDQLLWNLGDPLSMRIPLSIVMWNNTLLAIIGLCGGIAFLAATREGNPSWYLGIPLIASYAIIAVSPLAAGFFVINDPSPPLYHPGVILSLLISYGTVFLLPPCAALFFWSQRAFSRWAEFMSVLSLLITLNSLVLTFYLFSPYLVSAGLLSPTQPQFIDGHPVKTDGEGLLFLFIHYMIGLPLLGICFLVLAVLNWCAARKTGSGPSPSAEVLR